MILRTLRQDLSADEIKYYKTGNVLIT